MFKPRKGDKPSKHHCVCCKEAFDLDNPRVKCVVCDDANIFYCTSCARRCAQCPEEANCYLCPNFHPHECAWPDCERSLCNKHRLQNPFAFFQHDQSLCLCNEHKAPVVKRMREIVRDEDGDEEIQLDKRVSVCRVGHDDE